MSRLQLYRHLPNVLATQHIGYTTREVFEIFFREAAENITAFMAGAPLREARGDKGRTNCS